MLYKSKLSLSYPYRVRCFTTHIISLHFSQLVLFEMFCIISVGNDFDDIFNLAFVFSTIFTKIDIATFTHIIT